MEIVGIVLAAWIGSNMAFLAALVTIHVIQTRTTVAPEAGDD